VAQERTIVKTNQTARSRQRDSVRSFVWLTRSYSFSSCPTLPPLLLFKLPIVTILGYVVLMANGGIPACLRIVGASCSSEKRTLY